MEHRRLIEGLIKRNLLPEECVHHINVDPSDNDPENLLVCDWSTHNKIHRRYLDLLKTHLPRALLIQAIDDVIRDHTGPIKPFYVRRPAGL